MLRIGCDLCRMDLLDQMLKNEPEALERLFHPEERGYALSQKEPARHLAGVFAAKEALAKAIREPKLLGKYHLDVTVVHRENGAPELRLSDRLFESLSDRGIRVADCSISHDGDYALAAVLIEKKPLRCGQCGISLSALEERGISRNLLQIVDKSGQAGYLCPVCFRGW